ncbi:MAG: hypothetical protein NVSMB29_16110 [Candidatus Dormibacteria bacterium]
MLTQPQAPTWPGVAGTERWELLRALGAAVLTPPPGNAGPCEALGLPAQTGVEHTRVFVLTAPPHAAIHLGPEGQLGGEGLDRISGFWRALGLQAPEDADHLGTLLLLYAELGQAESGAVEDRVRGQMRRARTALFHEHLWSWAPGYLAAVGGLDLEATAAWAELTDQALRAELAELGPAARLPLALRVAPAALAATDSFDETLDAVVAPIRSGMILTYRDLAACGEQAGVGVRRGERRYALKAMLLQDAAATLTWLADHARLWSQRHGAASPPGDPGRWWAERAAHSHAVLAALAQEAACSPPAR